MQAEKKKLAVIGALAVVMLCLGVFQFTKKSTPEVTPHEGAKAKSHTAPSTERVVASNTGGQPVNAEALNNASGPSRVRIAPPTAPGLQPEHDATVKTTKLGDSTSTSDGDTSKTALNSGLKSPAVNAEADLPDRDPFQAKDSLVREDLPPKSNATPPHPIPIGGGPIRTMPVSPIAGTSFAPIGIDGKPALLPPAVHQGPDYSVSGVIVGDHPAAVLVDSKGNQRLIRLGGSLDGDTKIVAISRGKVTLKSHGKTMTLTVGDNPTEKRSDEK